MFQFAKQQKCGWIIFASHKSTSPSSSIWWFLRCCSRAPRTLHWMHWSIHSDFHSSRFVRVAHFRGHFSETFILPSGKISADRRWKVLTSLNLSDEKYLKFYATAVHLHTLFSAWQLIPTFWKKGNACSCLSWKEAPRENTEFELFLSTAWQKTSQKKSLLELEYDKAVIKCHRTSGKSERQMGF